MFPLDIRQALLAAMSTTKYIATVTQEFDKFEKSLGQLKNSGAVLGDKPLIVITAGKPLTAEKTGYPQDFVDKLAIVWPILQKDLATKSTKAKQVFAENSGHMITREQPEIIVDSIKEICDGMQ